MNSSKQRMNPKQAEWFFQEITYKILAIIFRYFCHSDRATRSVLRNLWKSIIERTVLQKAGRKCNGRN